MTSPLGVYGPLVAAITSGGVIAAFVLATLLQGVLELDSADLGSLREIALLALGAVLALPAGAASNRQDIVATNRRLDAIGAPTAAEAERTMQGGPG